MNRSDPAHATGGDDPPGPKTAGSRRAARDKRALPLVPLERRPAVRILHLVNRLFARTYHHTTVLVPQRLPREGAAILVCNHISGLDPLLIQSVCPRPIVWMMAGEYYNIRVLHWGFKTIEAIPVERSGRDMAATRSALRALGNGNILGVFPEGRIESTRELLPFQIGVAMMAIKMNVPVYPAYIDGTQHDNEEMLPVFVNPNESTLAFGPPVEFGREDTGHATLDAATDEIRQSIERLRVLTGQIRSTRIGWR